MENKEIIAKVLKENSDKFTIDKYGTISYREKGSGVSYCWDNHLIKQVLKMLSLKEQEIFFEIIKKGESKAKLRQEGKQELLKDVLKYLQKRINNRNLGNADLLIPLKRDLEIEMEKRHGLN